jgi:hypothetical protein
VNKIKVCVWVFVGWIEFLLILCKAEI